MLDKCHAPGNPYSLLALISKSVISENVVFAVSVV